MSSRKRSSSQAAKDKAALKYLQKSGAYKGTIDLRKKPTRYQLKKIAEVKASRSHKKQPLPPAQKVPGAKITRKRMSEKEVRELSPTGGNRLTTYALPFLRKGTSEPEWRRFTRKGLTQFINEYKSDDPEGGAEWKSYAVREEWTFTTKTEKTDFKREADLYFSGVRISEPKGGVTQKRGPNKKAHRGKKSSR